MNYYKKIMLKMLLITFFVSLTVILMEINYPSIEIVIIVLFSIIGAIATFISILFDVIFKIPRKIKQKHNGIKDSDKYNDNSDLENILYESKIKLENKRKEAIKYLIIMCVIFLSLMIINLACIELNLRLRITMFFSSVFLFGIIVLKYENKRKNYTFYYKENIVSELLKSIDINIRYDPNGDEDNYKRFINAGFIEPKYNKYTIKDTISKNNTDDFFVLNKIDLIDKGHKAEILVDSFVFSYININSFSPIQLSMRRNSKINEKDIDNTNFERYFITDFNTTFGEFKIIIDNIINIVIEYYNKYKIDFNLKIKDKGIYIKFYINNSILETPFILKKSTDINTLKSNYIIMKGMVELGKQLKNIIEKNDIY